MTISQIGYKVGKKNGRIQRLQLFNYFDFLTALSWLDQPQIEKAPALKV
jgi:hypothetical protein